MSLRIDSPRLTDNLRTITPSAVPPRAAQATAATAKPPVQAALNAQSLRAHLNGLSEAQRSAQDGAALLQTAVGALDDVNAVLQRMRDLAAEASSAALTATERRHVHAELAQLTSLVDHVATRTTFNGQRLLDGSLANGATIPLGDDGARAVHYRIASVTATDLGLRQEGTGKPAAPTTSADAAQALASIQLAIQAVSAQQSELLATVNGLRFTVSNLSLASGDAGGHSNRITGLAMAAEAAKASQAQIVSQAATAMLAQAARASQRVLRIQR